MPNQSHSSIRTGPWHRCDRCGREFQEFDLTRQRGLIVCTVSCVDDPLSWQRDQIMREVLENSEKEMDVMEVLKDTPDVDVIPDEL